ncbi:alkaline phosphatase D family protein [Yinghuangia soli]|uniref:Alkaline phosphatase D family protein n=1 Tax=Yinghuangia soli TaxID=2908204 RepID=A0AA41PXM4_9ACTN|nr:alkaline phosphatase D family protein [Yinghuangia soli]MCF2527770.1 alkaline phosphatase D family protein [Yinghuangia soli]
MTRIPLHRRDFIRITAAASGAAAVGAVAAPSAQAGEATAAGATSPGAFLHGVASGDPLPDGVVIWTRVTPGADCGPGSRRGPSGLVFWEVAADREFRRPVRVGLARTGPERDHTVSVDVRGLRPGTTYYYRFRTLHGRSPVGRTRTAPSSRQDVAGLRFGVASCVSYGNGYFAGYRHLAQRGDLDAVIHLGDYIYEFASKAGHPGSTEVRPMQPEHECVTLADYRTRHGQYRTDPDLQAMHAAAPIIATWDDHELAGDAWAQGARDHDPATEGTWAARVAAAKQAYFEWLPVRQNVPGSTQRRLAYGKLLDLTMLDLRSFRSQQVLPTDAAGLADPSRTIAGRSQMGWLKDGLARSTAAWNLIGTSVMAAPWRLPTGQANPPTTWNADQWDGYQAEQKELFTHLQNLGKSNTVFLTGDLHSSWAGEVPAPGGGAPVAAQFVVTSVTSTPFASLYPAGYGAQIVGAILKMNPHLQWGEAEANGVGILDVTAARVQLDWYKVADRKLPDSTVAHLKSFQVDGTTKRVGPAANPV